jgi:hypothetical protein
MQPNLQYLVDIVDSVDPLNDEFLTSWGTMRSMSVSDRQMNSCIVWDDFGSFWPTPVADGLQSIKRQVGLPVRVPDLPEDPDVPFHDFSKESSGNTEGGGHLLCLAPDTSTAVCRSAPMRWTPSFRTYWLSCDVLGSSKGKTSDVYVILVVSFLPHRIHVCYIW